MVYSYIVLERPAFDLGMYLNICVSTFSITYKTPFLYLLYIENCFTTRTIM